MNALWATSRRHPEYAPSQPAALPPRDANMQLRTLLGRPLHVYLSHRFASVCDTNSGGALPGEDAVPLGGVRGGGGQPAMASAGGGGMGGGDDLDDEIPF